jgi:putative membrane protein
VSAGSGGPDEAPDPRFSLANERTFLAWIRTALALLAAAAGLSVVDVPWPVAVVRAIGCVLAVCGGVCALLAWSRWRSVEEAIAEGRAAPVARARTLVAVSGAVGVVAVAVVVLVLVTS